MRSTGSLLGAWALLACHDPDPKTPPPTSDSTPTTEPQAGCTELDVFRPGTQLTYGYPDSYSGGYYADVLIEDTIEAGSRADTIVHDRETTYGWGTVRELRVLACTAEGLVLEHEEDESRDTAGNVTYGSSADYDVPVPYLPVAFDSTWWGNYAYDGENSSGQTYRIEGVAMVSVGPTESVETPAGPFDAVRVTRVVAGRTWWSVEWYAPGLGLVAAADADPFGSYPTLELRDSVSP